MQRLTVINEPSLRACLGQLAFFQGWTDAEVGRVVRMRHGVHFQAYRMGEFFIREQAFDTNLYIMLVGRASVVKTGSSIPLAELGAGQFFGEVSFLTTEPRGTNVIAHGSGPI
ncbi:MAG: cyclic nucleotide-binding domain-containing protein, partial [Magnetococcales bacterium]|nr:cyclic nucleotide-binding domain-containing protein [Magnetococcales bacterium]